MREVAKFERKSRRELRRLSRRERRQYVREMREAARETHEERPSRRLPPQPDVQKDFVEGEAAVQAAEAAMTQDTEAHAPAGPALPQVEFSGIPWTYSGPLSLNPLPRYASRDGLDWRR
ncbi:hypothetical protein [Methylobacterium nodulans]|uniref:Uncharacterized protein n=1 Tax=Methylobacterium nodulans (strain LMG 21967 / CNCM I-2342 / ORS 2060) TaxID=460265 RepID=B8IGA2_METNO|nr:hypothetical protein [Methylobacterium nodulans]ACL61579.1 hypothetical protein Mnod_6824 [Methylobacterium nodulans ORS 2060]